jgi:hypothetical protein
VAAKEITGKKYVVRLSTDERAQLNDLIRKGKRSAQLLTKARILLKADVSEAGERAIEDLDYRFEAVELILLTLAKKEGLTDLQVKGNNFRPLLTIWYSRLGLRRFSRHLERVLALADR